MRLPRLLGALLAAALLAATALSSPVRASGAPFAYYPGTPEGNVGVSEPTIADDIVLSGVTPQQVSFVMTLNGAPVPAAIDPDGSRIAYRPATPLPPGPYAVDLHIQVGDWYADVAWSFTVLPGAVATLPAPSPAAALALAWINAYRAQAQLPPLSPSPALNAAAAAHAAFYLANEARYGGQITTSVHAEDPSWPGFTGQDPLTRAGYFGFGYGGVIEDMSFGSGVAGAIDGWIDSVYHRFAITDSLARFAGFAIAGGSGADPNQPVTDLEVGEAGNGPADPATSVVYPAPGQTGVPTAFPAGEVPDPLSAFPGAAYPAGFPVTLQFDSPAVSAVQVASAQLTTAAGTPVPFDLLTGNLPGGGQAASEMGNAVALIPQQPLTPATTYRAVVAGTVTDDGGGVHPFRRDWSFTTSAWVDPGQLSADQAADGTITLRTAGNTAQAAVFVGGYPVVGLSHLDGQTLSFRLPPGLPPSADLWIVQPDGQEESWPGFVGPAGFTAPAGNPPGTAGAGTLTAGRALLVPLAALGSVQANRIAANAMTVLQDSGGNVLGAFRLGDPVGYLRGADGTLRRQVWANPPLQRGGTVYVPAALAAAAGLPLPTTAGYAPAGYAGPLQLSLTIGAPRFVADGQPGSWSPDLGAPFVAPPGVTLLPVRALATLFGLAPGAITWYGPNHTPASPPVQEVDLQTPWGTTIRITPDQVVRIGPGGAPPAVIPFAPGGFLVVGGRTYVPFRALAYAFGLDANQVSWTADPVTGAVTTVSLSWLTAP